MAEHRLSMQTTFPHSHGKMTRIASGTRPLNEIKPTPRSGNLRATLRAFTVLAILLTASPATAQSASVKAQELTVPSDRLPDGCQLAPAPSVPVGPNQVQTGLWGGLQLPSNPWAGHDAPLAGKIRELVDGARRVPDGPPLSRAELARLVLRLAEDVEEAYAAFYNTPDGRLVSVFAMRLNAPIDGNNDAELRESRVRIGAFVAAHSGDGGECHNAVINHLLTLGR